MCNHTKECLFISFLMLWSFNPIIDPAFDPAVRQRNYLKIYTFMKRVLGSIFMYKIPRAQAKKLVYTNSLLKCESCDPIQHSCDIEMVSLKYKTNILLSRRQTRFELGVKDLRSPAGLITWSCCQKIRSKITKKSKYSPTFLLITKTLFVLCWI